MRYAFHGKVRATGERIDGYVEAVNSTEAFDKLADQGIIGVHTVRPDPEAKSAAVLPPPVNAEVVMVQLVEKMNTLIGHVEKLLSRPATVISAPARDGGRSKRITPKIDAAQDEALRAIFQTNMELRRSIQKLDALTGGSSGPTPGPGSPSNSSTSNGPTLSKPVPAVARPGETRLGSGPVNARSREPVSAQPAA